MSDDKHKRTRAAQTRPEGEQERDNDAHRPDGSGGTGQDSTAQQAARGKGQRRP